MRREEGVEPGGTFVEFAAAAVEVLGWELAYALVQGVKRDGKPWTRNWIGHDFFREGGVLELVLGDKESEWGTKEEDLPPSVGWDK